MGWLLFFNYKAIKFENNKTLNLKTMFGIFKKKSEADKLQDKYKKVMEEAYKLQSINRTDSDSKYKEADDILKKIDALKAEE